MTRGDGALELAAAVVAVLAFLLKLLGWWEPGVRMIKGRLARRGCHFVVEPETETCPNCGSSSPTGDRTGYVVIAHPEDSEIAAEMEVALHGKYALKLR